MNVGRAMLAGALLPGRLFGVEARDRHCVSAEALSDCIVLALRAASKDSLRVHAMGDVDELNSNIGVLLCEELPPAVRELLVEVQHQLFNLGGEMSIPGFELLKAEALLALDQALAEHNEQLPRLQEFILPAGTRAASLAQVCRTVARRAERSVVALGVAEALKDTPRQYLNRLSDLMFVLARVLNRMHGGDDVYWKSERMARGEAE